MAKSVIRKVVVDLFYDVISPYCWITFNVLLRYQKKFPQIELRLKPALLGAIMKELKHAPPPAAKSTYSKLDLLHLSNYFHVPYKRPHNTQEVMFERGSLQAQRLLTVVAQESPLQLEALSRTLFLRVWYQHRIISSLDGLHEACIDSGLSEQIADNYLQQINNSKIKMKLQNITQSALDCGAFGLPTYIAYFPDGPKLFFGSDRLFLFAHFLNEYYPGPLHEFK